MVWVSKLFFRAERVEEKTVLLSEAPTRMVSSLVEVAPDTPAQTLGAGRQPVAVVVCGLPLPERVKLAGAVTRQMALAQRGMANGAGKR